MITHPQFIRSFVYAGIATLLCLVIAYPLSYAIAFKVSDGTTDAKAREAVMMTRGLVLGYQGLLVSGYYSSCCGGVAASATKVR